MEFEWKIFQGFTTAGILSEIQKMMTELKCAPEDFHGRIIFMSMFNDIVLDAKEMKNYVKIIQNELKSTFEDFLAVIGLSLDLVQKKSGTPHTIANQTDAGIGLRRK